MVWAVVGLAIDGSVKGRVSVDVSHVSLDVTTGHSVGSLQHLDRSSEDLVPSSQVLLQVGLGGPVRLEMSVCLTVASDFTLISAIGIVLHRRINRAALLTESECDNIARVCSSISNTFHSDRSSSILLQLKTECTLVEGEADGFGMLIGGKVRDSGSVLMGGSLRVVGRRCDRGSHSLLSGSVLVVDDADRGCVTVTICGLRSVAVAVLRCVIDCFRSIALESNDSSCSGLNFREHFVFFNLIKSICNYKI